MLKWRGLCRIEIFIHAKWRHVYMYGAQNEAYKGERGRKTRKDVYLQGVARNEAVRAAQNEAYKKLT